MSKFKFIVILCVVSSVSVKSLRADEGMWLPLLLNEQKIEDMQKKGFKLTAEDVFSMNQSSLKDAVVRFGGGCTGELISDKGLLITNHHCGYGQIQRHSSIEHDYLTDGFWAMSQKDELVNPGLEVRFLDKIIDVTDEVLKNIGDDFSEYQRSDSISNKIKELVNIEIGNNPFKFADIQPFFYGNQYFMFVYDIYKDVRLVGAPPSSIGKFGGDTDNWIWPRHTGDFSLFRIYANKNNEPAEYSEDNIPYTPKKSFEIALDGVKDGEFTMVYGFPGRTQRYLASYEVDYLLNKEYPQRIKLRDYRLKVMQQAMDENPEVRIKYSAKYAGTSNAWKKWQGVIRGLNRLDAVEVKKSNEKKFISWAELNHKEYKGIINEFENVYKDYNIYSFFVANWSELFSGSEILALAYGFEQFVETYHTNPEMAKTRFIPVLKGRLESFYKDYHQPIDKDITAYMLASFNNDVENRFHPEIYNLVEKKFKDDFEKYTEYLFNKTIFLDQSKTLSLLNNFDDNALKTLEKDPVLQLTSSFYDAYIQKVYGYLSPFDNTLDSLYRKYTDALQKMYPDSIFSPDANSTLRITFGSVSDYTPRDAVNYEINTTLKGVIEKINPEIYDYNVPQRLIDLYNNKDYGRYGKDQTMPVCFIASNHTSGGNSGSPVLNSKGQLIGVNFDRNWEGTMSDIMYDPSQCRNISLDIRYALFLIDKFAGASYLIDEMKLVD